MMAMFTCRDARKTFRHRQQSEAIQTAGVQLQLSLDCFALLAMTGTTLAISAYALIVKR
jgi:hypothetical protein